MKKFNIITTIFIIISMLAISFGDVAVAKDKQIEDGPEVTDYFNVLDKNGNSKIVHIDDIENDNASVNDLDKEYELVAKNGSEEEVIETFDSKEEASKVLESKRRKRSSTTYSLDEKLKEITYGVVYLNSKSVTTNSSGVHYSYIPFDNVSNPGYTGYTTGSYAKDAAYIGMVNGKIRAMQAGVVMDIHPGDATVVEYTQANISCYSHDGKYLRHNYYYGSASQSNQIVGYALDYLEKDKKYYSYDGHYFYSDYPTMISDYQNNSRSRSVNSTNPYYNYYQFISHRTKSSLTASNFDTITNSVVGSESSKMRDMGKYFIDHQNTYGANSLLMFGVAANESGWGRSQISNDKNNLFGHGAVDSNPYWGASGYASPADSIKYHAERYISNGYLDNEDSRYRGGNLGDKSCGMNVKYASDPYWGEKAAAINYTRNLGDDFNKYTIGIINGVQKSYKLYKEPSYSSAVTHTLGSDKSPHTYNLPVIILDKVTDSSGVSWYKIQSDTTLNGDRTDTNWNGRYDFSRDYLYIPAPGVTVIKQGNSTVYKYLPGDVNGDGKVTSLDYIQIKNHIMQSKVLSGDVLIRADVNVDGKVTSLDYIKVKNHIMKVNSLF